MVTAAIGLKRAGMTCGTSNPTNSAETDSENSEVELESSRKCVAVAVTFCSEKGTEMQALTAPVKLMSTHIVFV